MAYTVRVFGNSNGYQLSIRLVPPKRSYMPLHGYVDEISRTKVVGWALDSDRPKDPIEVVVLVDAKESVRLTTDRQREGLRTIYPGATGCHGFEYHFPRELARAREVVVTFAANAKVLKHGSKVFSTEAGLSLEEKPSLLPVGVNGLGRSGTTLLMSTLLSHPKIAGARTYPFEIKLLVYYSLALRVLTSPADRERSMDPDTMVGNRYTVGFNPYNAPSLYRIVRNPQVLERYFTVTGPETLRETFRNLIVSYYDAIRSEQDREHAGYFVEKLALEHNARQGTRRLFGTVREIMLIRDPRDLLCSMKSFWQRPSEAAYREIASASQQLLTLARDAPHDVLFVRYEDLVLQSELAMSEIYRFLDLEPDSSGGNPNLGIFPRHGTSESPVKSVGRWQRELGATEIAMFGRELRPFMERFGYDI